MFVNEMTNNKLPPAIFLMGPTAAGKTALGLELAKQFPCEIVSVDSVMVYKGMDIGAAKPGKEVLRQTPHHLIDIRDPAGTYSVFEFREDALSAMEKITQKGKIPLLLGGTMLYFKALTSGLATLPAGNEQVRGELNKLALTIGWEGLHKKLLAVDPIASQRIKPTDTQRLLRALEVFELTGNTLTFWHQHHIQSTFPYYVLNIILYPFDRVMLHQRIEKRFNEMVDLGFVDEVSRLFQRGDINSTMPAMRSIGYKQIWSYLNGELIYDQAVQYSVAATRQFAKRQLTWLRGWNGGEICDAFSPYVTDKVLKMVAPVF